MSVYIPERQAHTMSDQIAKELKEHLREVEEGENLLADTKKILDKTQMKHNERGLMRVLFCLASGNRHAFGKACGEYVSETVLGAMKTKERVQEDR